MVARMTIRGSDASFARPTAAATTTAMPPGSATQASAEFPRITP
jgi:hypothetical protein